MSWVEEERAELRHRIAELEAALARTRAFADEQQRAAAVARESARVAWKVGISVHAAPRGPEETR